MAKVGIFWVHKGVVLGRARDLEDAEEGVPGLLDSPDSHVDLWSEVAFRQSKFPELRDTAYEDVPRGRALYDLHHKSAIVYYDRTLDRPGIRSAIAEFFGFDETAAAWESDPHYTINRTEIDASFE